MVSGGNRHGRTSEPGRVGGEVGMSLSSSVTAKPNAILGSSIRRELATGRKQQSCNSSTLRPPGSCRVRSNRVIQKTQGLGGKGSGWWLVASGWGLGQGARVARLGCAPARPALHIHKT